MSLSDRTRGILPADTAKTWEIIAPHVPKGFYLGGGTGVGVHLQHRESQDLDFFSHGDGVDLDAWEKKLQQLGLFARTQKTPDTLNGVFSATKVQFFKLMKQKILRPPSVVDGIRVASLDDLLAMKIKVLRDRRELRDYYDIMMIEEKGHRTIEEGFSLCFEKYQIDDTDAMFQQLVRALGGWDALGDDAIVPIPRKEVQDFWRRRYLEVIRNLGSTLTPATRVAPARLFRPVPAIPGPAGTGRHPGDIWVSEHSRTGKKIRGYWRRKA